MFCIELRPNFVIVARLFSICGLIIFGVSLNQYSLAFFALTLASLYLLKKKRVRSLIVSKEIDELDNPYKKVKETSLSDLPQDTLDKAKNELLEHFLEDFSRAESLESFQLVKQKSECVFAKHSKVWGAPKWNNSLTVEENTKLFIPSFILFCNFCVNLKLDGYLIELPGQIYGRDLIVFARTFHEILNNFSDNDPKKSNCMKRNIDSSGWVFEFCGLTFFITTMAPFYPDTNSRSTYGVDECFILFQPEVSFAIKNIPSDTSVTNWFSPVTVRDKIRVAFKQANREYFIRDTIRYPMSHDLIKPIHKNDPIIKWWTF